MKILLANFTKMVNDSGGMSKVMCAFANEMVSRGHEVTIVYSDDKDGDFYYPVDSEIKCYDLRKLGAKRINLPLWKIIERELWRPFDKKKTEEARHLYFHNKLAPYCEDLINKIRPDVIVSSNINTSGMIICKTKTSIPVITMSHGDVSDYFTTYPDDSIKSMTLSKVVQVLLPSYKKMMAKGAPGSNIVVIGNAVPQYDFYVDLSKNKSTYTIVTVGRLTKNIKRQHLLIQAFAKVADKFLDWNLEIWGAKDRATYYKQLQAMIKVNHLDNRIFLKGATKDVPNDVLKHADIFAFPSSAEGFGLALAEGMSAGLPAVGYKSCNGVNELIKDGKTGILCDDGVEPLTQALDKLMGDKELRVQMGKAAKADMAQFAPEKNWDQWEELMEKVIKEK